MAEEKQDNQKAIVAFVVGLLIGGLLVWAFSGPSDTTKTDKHDDDTEEVTQIEAEGEILDTSDTSSDEGPATLSVGEGKVVVNDQAAGMSVALESATYPVGEGWIGVRTYTNDNLGSILGVVRFSESQGLVPSDIILQAPTKAGSKYAVVVFTENGDFDFSLADDVQIDTIFTTFTAK